jgi:N-acetyl-gamma-glutamyl-phosphate reductase
VSAAPAVWVLGGTGYSGLEAVGLLLRHPFFRLERVLASPGSPPRDLEGIEPGHTPDGLRAEPYSSALLETPPEAVVLALPDRASADLAPEFLRRGTRVVDLSGAFRVRDPSHYTRHCGFDHPHPAFLDKAVYGLAEREAANLPGATLVANPGCYPTAVLLALLPLTDRDLLDPRADVIVDAKSGVTGAGRKVEAAYLFAEVNENLRPYGALRHRHVPEILQALGFDAGRELLFVPHLLPVSRGLMATSYVRLGPGVTGADLAGAYARAYEGSAFVRILGEGRWPDLRGAARTNRCDIGWIVDSPGRTAVVVSVIDNLLKGAAGQAVQNLNLMFGRPEAEGLPA